MAFRAGVLAALEDLDNRRVEQVQESILQTMEIAERKIKDIEESKKKLIETKKQNERR
jgi:hypothetical protein